MRICLPNDSKMSMGGGWTFRDNLQASRLFTVAEDDWEVALVAGATMVTRDTWRTLKAKGPVALRVDGVPEDWRNRGTGWPRPRDFAHEADLVIFQSKFIKRTLGTLLEVDGPVIYNGVDQSVFNAQGESFPKFGSPSILHVNYRDDPNKRIEEVIAKFRELKTLRPGLTLTFLGKYPTYLSQWGFGMLDFMRDRDWRYAGVVKEREELARWMRSHDWFAFPSFADPCPNTLIEALACGLIPIWINKYGGAWEIVQAWDHVDWSLHRMAEEYREALRELLWREQT